MCGFLVYQKSGDNSRIQLRGQDYTNSVTEGGFTFIHNLLAVTGTPTKQPFIDEGIVCVYNGEIYNQPFVKSDGECLIPLYKKYGELFPRYLDGEFAVALYDLKSDITIFATDAFGTKPLFVNGKECGSYRSGVGGEKLPANTIMIVKGNNVETKSVVEWDLTQYKDNYEDWISAFEVAIKKRAVPNCFMGLSSGYDSGAIANELKKQGFPFTCYTYEGSEDRDILDKRAEIFSIVKFEPDPSLMDFLRANVDDEPYTIKYKSGRKFSVLTEGGTLGVASFCKIAHENNQRVCLSSQGADEILSDYSPFPDQSELCGEFPQELHLWDNFCHGCQESYLMKEEYAGGAFNVETRYPFLDNRLVQEFLWLKPELKNEYYKAPLREYLIRNRVPFKEGVKVGFSVNL